MCESDTTSQTFDHPVYKKLSRIYGEINKMNNKTLKLKISTLKLDNRGVAEVLRKRLKFHYKKLNIQEAGIQAPRSDLDYLLVIDFEATCEVATRDYNHEIIEFPIILVDVKQQQIVGEFHEYVRPCVNRRLTKFCTTLTGITQDVVDRSDDFLTVLSRVNPWIEQHSVNGAKRFVVVTDGTYDMGRFMLNQCHLSNIDHPLWARKWVNLRKVFSNTYSLRRCSLSDMLGHLKMEFEGTPHSGHDDAHNIARIAIQLLKDGGVLRPNESLSAEQVLKPVATTSEPRPDSSGSSNTSCEKPANARRRPKPKGPTKPKRPEMTVLERSLEILAEDRDNGANPDDLDTLWRLGLMIF